MKAGRMRRRIGRTPAEQPVEPAGEIVPHGGRTLLPDIMLVVTLLTSGKLMQSERQDLSIYRAMGLPCTAPRRSFSLRFLLVSLVGSEPP